MYIHVYLKQKLNIHVVTVKTLLQNDFIPTKKYPFALVKNYCADHY